MAAGSFVFPVVVGVFVIFLGGYLGSTTVKPNLVVEPGDLLEVELTEYYGGGFVSRTSRVDLLEADRLRPSPYGVFSDDQPVRVQVPDGTRPGDESIFAAFLDQRIDDTFETGKWPNLFGQWREQVLLPPLGFEFEQRFAVSDDPFSRFVRNYTQVTQDAKDQGVAEVRPGAVFKCEGDTWPCLVVDVDAEAREIVFDRVPQPGDRYTVAQMEDLVEDIFQLGSRLPLSDLVIRSVGDGLIRIEWDHREHDAFILGVAASGWSQGAYRIIRQLPGGNVTAFYLPLEDVIIRGFVRQAYMIGEPVWYEFTVVNITKPAPTPT